MNFLGRRTMTALVGSGAGAPLSVDVTRSRNAWLRRLRVLGVLACATAAAAAQAGDHIFADSFERISKVAQPDVEIALADDSVWNALKARCDQDLNNLIGDIYAGFDWRQAAQDYGLCYNVGTLRGDVKAPIYSKKAIAILKT